MSTAFLSDFLFTESGYKCCFESDIKSHPKKGDRKVIKSVLLLDFKSIKKGGDQIHVNDRRKSGTSCSWR